MRPSPPRKKDSSASPRAPAAPQRLSANMEDYLEAIYKLSQEHGVSRVSSIADALGVKRPSVSKALKRLQREGLVSHTPYGGAEVTPRGKQVAQAQVRSHRALTQFLEKVLALRPELAEHDACLMEHAISHETVERLVCFIDYLEHHGVSVIEAFRGSLPAADTHASDELKTEKKRTSRAKKDGLLTNPGRVWTSRV